MYLGIGCSFPHWIESCQELPSRAPIIVGLAGRWRVGCLGMLSRSPETVNVPVINFQPRIYVCTRALHIIREVAKSAIVIRYSMAFKRKRSDFETSPSSSSTATFPSRDPSSSPCPDISMFDDASFAEQPIYRPDIVPSHLNSRTRKRFRDNRPDESKIHGIYSCNGFETLLLHVLPLSLTWLSVSNNVSKTFLSGTIPSPH